MPHSPLSLRLRAEVIESEYDFDLRLAYMQAYASIHAHPDSKIEEAFNEFNSLFGDARGSIPYMTGGKRGKELMQDERMELVKAYEAMSLKQRADYKPPTEKLQVKRADT